MRLGETDLMLSPPCRDTGTARQGSHPVLGVLSTAGDPFSWIRHHPAATVGRVALLELRRWQGTEEGSPQRVTMMRGGSRLMGNLAPILANLQMPSLSCRANTYPHQICLYLQLRVTTASFHLPLHRGEHPLCV